MLLETLWSVGRFLPASSWTDNNSNVYLFSPSCFLFRSIVIFSCCSFLLCTFFMHISIVHVSNILNEIFDSAFLKREIKWVGFFHHDWMNMGCILKDFTALVWVLYFPVCLWLFSNSASDIFIFFRPWRLGFSFSVSDSLLKRLGQTVRVGYSDW